MAAKAGPNPAKFSGWFGVAAVGAALLLITLWNTKYRTVAMLIVFAVLIGWVLRYYPQVKSQVGGGLHMLKGKG